MRSRYLFLSIGLFFVIMAAESFTDIIFRHWFTALLIVFVSYLLKNRFNRGLNKYPGPFLASLTDWWRFWNVYRRRPEATHIKLHAQHGDIVRLGPNALSFADPKALKVIYGLNKGFTKVRASLLSTLVNNVNTNQIYSPSSTLCNSL
jgi:hypothetical protein